ncbi:MAG: tRNA uridine(34) 5-carboxymethylaminomethyl modification radical SAM/GNAT enzyme Elp3 [Candidatus Aenigmarchaeota archaeon]|nr:tRNA uridine(34) 5-carboxymethylaminomethyl modification radical SAM/GNAT enzyme Elp3 [Candidatus Aenigmarchaeota archaeon]
MSVSAETTNVKKKVRTISGVSIVAVMTKPLPCPGKCIYCPGGIDKEIPTPKSYLPKSPVVMRAARDAYDPYLQTASRLKALKSMGHITDKVEIIVMGGTFMATPVAYRHDFIKGCYDGLNGFVSNTLADAKNYNETAENRCVAMCIETRPDWAYEYQINQMLDFGATRVELGVQIPDDENYVLTKRGHTVKDVIESTRLLKDSGFKVYYHYMCNLPGSELKKDLEMFKVLFENPDFRPDGVKIYPCLVLENTELQQWFDKGEHYAYTNDELIELLVKIKKLVPRYARISRVMRDIPAEYVVGGTKYSHLRDAVKAQMSQKGMKCACTRCREVGYSLLSGKHVDENAIRLNRMDYEASDGHEIFLSFEDMKNDILLGLLRLRFPSRPFRPEITPTTSLVREIHVFGKETAIGSAFSAEQFQHRGFGKKLLEEAERISKENNTEKIAVISGVGARRYYRKLGYTLEGAYMVKIL